MINGYVETMNGCLRPRLKSVVNIRFVHINDRHDWATDHIYMLRLLRWMHTYASWWPDRSPNLGESVEIDVELK